MKTRMWLVRAASLAVVGTLTLAASAQKHHKKKAPAHPAEPAIPEAPTTPEKLEDGPFAPKGSTGKLRNEAQPEEEKPAPDASLLLPANEKRGAAGFDFVFGFGKTGGTTGPDAVELSVVSFVFGGSYQVTPNWGGRLRVPFSTGKITHVGNEPTRFEELNSGYNSNAFGNIELAGSYTLLLSAASKVPLELALALPTANGDRFPPPEDSVRGRHYRINAAAQASRGMEEDALFAPHRFGIVPKAAYQYRAGAIQTGAFIKVPFLIKAGGQPADVTSTGQTGFALNSTVIQGIFGGDFHYGFVDNKLDIGARAWATILSNEYYDVLFNGGTSTSPSKFQLVFEPQVRANIASVRAALGVILPLGGRLGGDQQVTGIRLMAAYVF